MSTPKFFDVHTHIQFAAFQQDAGAVISRALKAGVWMVNVGTQKDTSGAAIALAEKYDQGVYAAVGLHPIHTENSYHDPKEFGVEKQSGISDSRELKNRSEDKFDYDFYKKLAIHPKVVAIGECGLDYYRATSIKRHETKDKQRVAFLHQIYLAQELKKPLMIHCRSAFPDLIKVLVACRNFHVANPGIIHFFSGTKEDAAALLDLGFSFSFGGVITFARDYDEVIKLIPPERIVLETDAPYVAPVPYRGKRNEPVYVVETAKKIAAIKNINFEEIGRITTVNALRIFNLPLL